MRRFDYSFLNNGLLPANLVNLTSNKVIYERGLTHSELSDQISKDLKKRGMKFVGTTAIYAYLQAVGAIYSHDEGCFLEHKI